MHSAALLIYVLWKFYTNNEKLFWTFEEDWFKKVKRAGFD